MNLLKIVLISLFIGTLAQTKTPTTQGKKMNAQTEETVSLGHNLPPTTLSNGMKIQYVGSGHEETSVSNGSRVEVFYKIKITFKNRNHQASFYPNQEKTSRSFIWNNYEFNLISETFEKISIRIVKKEGK